VGKQWVTLGYHSIPKDPSITLQNAKSRKEGMILLHTAVTDKLLQPELIHFSIPSQATMANEIQRIEQENQLSLWTPVQ
jgi:hypothetical protein